MDAIRDVYPSIQSQSPNESSGIVVLSGPQAISQADAKLLMQGTKISNQFYFRKKKTTRNSNPKLFSNTKGVMQIKNSTQIDAVLVGEKSPFGQSITVRTLEKMTTVTGGEYRQLYFGK